MGIERFGRGEVILCVVLLVPSVYNYMHIFIIIYTAGLL